MEENLAPAHAGTHSYQMLTKTETTKAFLSLIFMAFILNYVESMVIPSIPVLQIQFGSTTATSAWLLSAFLITGTVAAPLFGKLGDNYGKKKMLLASFMFYTAGVGLAGFSPTMNFLIFSRALQGLGFGGIPLAFAIIIDMFPREKVSSAQGIMSGMFATGGVTGLVAGSYIIAYLGWQWAFHTALAASILLMIAIMLLVKKDDVRIREKIDFTGAVSLTAGLTLILLYVTRATSSGWFGFQNIALLAAGAVMVVFFLIWERITAEPLVQLQLLSQRNILMSNLIGIFAGVLMQLMFLSLVYFADDPAPFGDGFSNITTGLVLAPGAITMAAFGPFIGRVIARIGPKPILILGSGLLSTGLGIFLFQRTDLPWLVVAGIATWTGVVSIFVPMVNMIAVSLPPERRAIGMGMNMMLRSMGGAVGPALAASIMTLYSSPIAAAAAIQPAASLPSFPTPTAFNLLMEIGFLLVAIMVLLSLATRNYSFRKNADTTHSS